MNRVMFNTSCQACSRKLLVKIEYLGAELKCPHCHGCFIARDSPYSVADGPSIMHKLEVARRCAG